MPTNEQYQEWINFVEKFDIQTNGRLNCPAHASWEETEIEFFNQIFIFNKDTSNKFDKRKKECKQFGAVCDLKIADVCKEVASLFRNNTQNSFSSVYNKRPLEILEDTKQLKSARTERLLHDIGDNPNRSPALNLLCHLTKKRK